MKIKKVLIANRGEIAIRVIRACQEMGIVSAAIFSPADRDSRHVRLADESYALAGDNSKVYLDAAQIIALAKSAGAEAIHPGYGFLAENPGFAQECKAAGIIFIGPEPDVIKQMGSKIESRRIMEAAGVPVVPGTTEPTTSVDEVKALGTRYGYPLAIKASAGGGGRGLRVVRKDEEVEQALAGAQREGASYFGNGEVYVEKYLDRPRHIEVQILADRHGNVVHLFERDCSSQRRHQKLVEESPAANLPKDLRKRLLEAAVQAGKSIGYTSAGTVECLVSGNDFYFLEMNTRVQVEHPVTEFITGIDIVKEQIRVAAGEKLSFTQADVAERGHAIEFRINAEDPYKNFMPSPGTIKAYEEPSMPWVRVDSACYNGYQILPFYDSLLAKLVVWGKDRTEAIARGRLALRNFTIEGVKTTIPFHLAILDDEEFKAGKVYTGYVEAEFKKKLVAPQAQMPAATTAAAPAEAAPSTPAAPPLRTPPRTFEVEVNRRVFNVAVSELVAAGAAVPVNGVSSNSNGHKSGAGVAAGANGKGAAKPASRPRPSAPAAASGEVRTSMHGVLKQLLIKEGDSVQCGQKVAIFEAMKMESEILADRSGTVTSLSVQVGQTLEADQLLFVIKG